MEQEYTTAVSSVWVPRSIRVTGLPVMLHGWNATYTLRRFDADNNPVYTLDRYVLYFFILIAGVTISKLDGKWCLARNDWGFVATKEGDEQGTPFGYWGGGDGCGITVTGVY